ncbi:MAG: signal peptidase II [Clostridia bacterium]|nr:signal peptidase II [Clostridia bacterium]
MKCRLARDRMVALLIIIIVLLSDILTKRWALKNLLNGAGAIDAIPGIFRFRFAWNTGVAFSFLSGWPVLVSVFTVLVLSAVAVFLFFAKNQRLFDRVCLALIFAGGLGNFIDRIFYGAVVDFIEFTFISFPVFNFADVCVVTGTALYAVRVLIGDKRKAGSFEIHDRK